MCWLEQESEATPVTEGRLQKALLKYPLDVEVDAAGDVYVADTRNDRIRKIDIDTGLIETVAGTGDEGFGGDGGPAIEAYLDDPSAVAVDAAGDVYFVDAGNHRIRKIDIDTGLVETVAGTGDEGFGGDGGPATMALLNSPSDVAVDAAGDVYVADTYNHRIRKIDIDTGLIETVAGTGDEGFGGDGGPATEAQLGPRAVVVDAAGDMYVADYFRDSWSSTYVEYSLIRKIDAQTGIIQTIAGSTEGTLRTDGDSHEGEGDGGPAVEAILTATRGLTLDPEGNLYVSGSDLRVRRIDARTGVIETVAGSGEWGSTGFGVPAVEAEFSGLEGVAVDAAGNLYVADAWWPRVWVANPSTLLVVPIGDKGESLRIVVAEDGTLRVDGRLVVKGDRIVRNGKQYEVALKAKTGSGSIVFLTYQYEAVARPWEPEQAEASLLDSEWIASADSEMVENLLKELGRQVVMADEARIPLHLAAQVNSDPDVTRVLLDYGACVNCIDAAGRNPLHYAALNDNPEVAELLLDRGANPFWVDNQAKSPQELATEAGNTAVGELLAEHAERQTLQDPFQVPTWRLLYSDWARNATLASVYRRAGRRSRSHIDQPPHSRWASSSNPSG